MGITTATRRAASLAGGAGLYGTTLALHPVDPAMAAVETNVWPSSLTGRCTG